MKSLRVQSARADLTHSQREIWSPVFNPEKLTFSRCLRTKNAPKEVANSYRRESRGFFFGNLSSRASKRNLLVLVDPSLLHHTFLLGPARFTALRVSAVGRMTNCALIFGEIWALIIISQGKGNYKIAMETFHTKFLDTMNKLETHDCKRNLKKAREMTKSVWNYFLTSLVTIWLPKLSFPHRVVRKPVNTKPGLNLPEVTVFLCKKVWDYSSSKLKEKQYQQKTFKEKIQNWNQNPR